MFSLSARVVSSFALSITLYHSMLHLEHVCRDLAMNKENCLREWMLLYWESVNSFVFMYSKLRVL
jgi:hypothetical protein